MKLTTVAGLILVMLVVVVTAGIAATPQPGSEQDPLVSKSYVDQFVRFQVVTVPAGQRLEATSAGAEIIVRAGRATAVASEAGGLSNVTIGRDLGMNEAITANHLLIVPRADGRGVAAGTDVILMVRGGFVIR